MKKLKYLVVFALVLFLPFVVSVSAEKKTETKESKKVNVYLFRGDGCPHCQEAEEWFDELKNDEEYSKYYTLVDYEVWYNEDNASLMEKVAKDLGTEANGVPFIVIGEKYFSGFSKDMADDIKGAIKDAYNNKDYKDVVKGSAKANNKKVEKEKSILLPVIIISVVAVLSVIGMVFFTKEK